MTKAQKIDALYARAHGQRLNLSAAELSELNKYKISFNSDKKYATKKNIGAYVDAIDKGALRISFYDWCLNNNLGDRRFKGNSVEEMSQEKKLMSASAGFLGSLPWAFCLYWVTGGLLNVWISLILGAVISLTLYKLARKYVALVCFIAPIIIGFVVPTVFGYAPV